jgi:hypothetical protein
LQNIISKLKLNSKIITKDEKKKANDTLEIINKICGGVIEKGNKKGWPVNDPTVKLIIRNNNQLDNTQQNTSVEAIYESGIKLGKQG